MTDARREFRKKILGALASLAYRFPWWVVLAGALLALVSTFATREFLSFRTSRDDLISPDEEYVRIYRAYQQEFGDKDDLVVVVEAPRLRAAKAFAEELASRLQADPRAAREVLYRIRPEELQGRGLLYLSPRELEEIREKLEEHEDIVRSIGEDPRLETLLGVLNREISSALVGHLVSSFLGADDRDEATRPLDVSVLRNFLRGLGDALEGRPYTSVWRESLRPGSNLDEDGFLVSDDRRLVFVLVLVPDDTSVMTGAAEAIARVRKHIEAVRSRHPTVEVGITGGPALATEEILVSIRDTTLASVIALSGVALCFVLFYRDVARPLLAVATLTIGLAWSFGFATVAIGHLTILTVTFATFLIGMSDDFGVHLISRFEEELERGSSLADALRRTFVHSGGGIVSGALTFAIAFFAMALTDFPGIAELGVIGGGGILLCLVAMLTVFPALLVLYERWKAAWLVRWLDRRLRIPARLAAWRPAVLERLYRRPRTVLWAGLALSAISALGAPGVRMDFNLLRLQAPGTESVEWERKILERAGRSSQYAVSVVSTIEEARRLEERYERLPEVSRVESIASLIPPDQEARIREVERLRPLVARLPVFSPEPRSRPDPGRVRKLLESVRFKLREDREDRWDPARKPPEEELDAVRAELARVLGSWDTVAEPVLASRLASFERELFSELADQVRFLRENTSTEPVTLETLPPLLRRRFVGRTGKFLVQIFPSEDIWEYDRLTEFVAALRTVDPKVTGGAVSFYESARRMRDGYLEAGLYALVATLVLVLLDFRDVRYALLALLPLGIGGLWTLGLMRASGLSFNLANLILLPLIVGIGISNGIHIVHRHLEEGSTAVSVIALSTGKAVVLSSLTTMVGFGSLMVAQHRGIFSLGLLLTIGIGCNLLASITVLPALLRLLPVPAARGVAEPVRARSSVG